MLAKRDKIMRVRGRAECSHERASSKKTKNSHSMSCCSFNWKIFRGSESGAECVSRKKLIIACLIMFKLARQLFRCCSFWICDDFSICRALYPPRGKSKSFRITGTISTHRWEPSSRTSSIRDRCLVAGWHDDNVGKCRVLCRVLMIMTWHRELFLVHISSTRVHRLRDRHLDMNLNMAHKQQQEARRDCHVQQKLVVSPSEWMGGFYQVRK